MDIQKLTVSDLFFGFYTEGTEKEAEEFLNNYPYFKDVFTPKELSQDFRNRL